MTAIRLGSFCLKSRSDSPHGPLSGCHFKVSLGLCRKDDILHRNYPCECCRDCLLFRSYFNLIWVLHQSGMFYQRASMYDASSALKGQYNWKSKTYTFPRTCSGIQLFRLYWCEFWKHWLWRCLDHPLPFHFRGDSTADNSKTHTKQSRWINSITIFFLLLFVRKLSSLNDPLCCWQSTIYTIMTTLTLFFIHLMLFMLLPEGSHPLLS